MKADSRPLWIRPGVLACTIALALIYGSLIPFDFAWSDTVEHEGGVVGALYLVLASPQWITADPGQSSLGIPFALSDLLINLLLYVPLGVTLRMALRSHWRSAWLQVGGAVMIALVLSWGVESLQGLIPTRVASLADIAANTTAACVAAWAAPSLWQGYKHLVFWGYCRFAPLIAILRRQRDRPGVVMLLAVLNALVIGVWYVGELQQAGIGNQSALALPFERAFDMPYDLGVLMLGQALLVYAGIGCLLLLLTYTGRHRLAMGWVVLGVALVALAAELSRAATQNATPDITGPMLALTAGALMTITVYTFSFAVKRSNRRRSEKKYAGPERRREPHEYVQP